MFKIVGIGFLACLLAACGAPRPRPTPAQSPAASVPASPAAAALQIDAGQSEVRLLVYRGGALARLGHNHVMVNHSLSGAVNYAGNIATASFVISIPISGFSVDDTQARLQEGADFPGEIPAEAKAGTLHNMQSAAVLNAAQFPLITVKSTRISGTPGALSAQLTISIAGHDATITAPFTLQADPQRVAASGSFELQQTAIGLVPYSLMMGALQVQDALTVKFKIVAVSG